MKIGVVYPQTEYGSDPGAIRDFAQAAEQLGFSHIIAYDHVLGANPERPGGWDGPYTHESAFQEPFVLFSFMAAVTTTVRFVDRRHHPAPAPDSPGCQAGRDSGYLMRRPPATGHRPGLERN